MTDETPSRRGVISAGLFAATVPGALTSRAVAADDANDKPFADHHLVLQLSDREPAKRVLVLSVSNNVLKELGPDAVALEVVAFGAGIDLLRDDAPERERVDSLVTQGVRFSICMNTVESVERETGKKFPTNPNARPVPGGVVRILSLVEKGYTVVRP